MSWQAQGFRAWLWQRLTAIYIGLYLLVMSISLLLTTDRITYEQWHHWISQPYINVSLVLFFYAVLFHAWVGIRDIVIDYIKPVSLRLFVLTCIASGLFVMTIWVSLILMTVLQL